MDVYGKQYCTTEMLYICLEFLIDGYNSSGGHAGLKVFPALPIVIEIDPKIFSVVIFYLQLTQEGQLSVLVK